MANMNSTPVETVSINYKDFNESFLTCSICSCTYDGGEHTAKLLSCSHTICLHCVTQIAALETRNTGSFRCPICLELIMKPRDGVSALPPSFQVNQLLDLMKQRMEVIRQCSSHPGRELLFCGTCECVFCQQCLDGHHSDHTVVPFSVALKKISVTLLYKANECRSKLGSAKEAVTSQIRKIEAAVTAVNKTIDTHIDKLRAALDKRTNELILAATTVATQKIQLLEGQLKVIDAEKATVEAECSGVQQQEEVSEVSSRVKAMGARLRVAVKLAKPLENAFLAADFTHNDAHQRFVKALAQLGRIRTSSTFPDLCTLELESFEASGEMVVVLRTKDLNDKARNTGGDPVTAVATLNDTPLTCTVTDLDNGLYRILMRPLSQGTVCVHVLVFSHEVRDSPLRVTVTAPVFVFGRELDQPLPTTSFLLKWDAEQEAKAFKIVERNCSVKLCQESVNRLLEKADMQWDNFYNANENGFFDKHDWCLTECPVSAFVKSLEVTGALSNNELSCSSNLNILEIGCGVGNVIFSILQKSQNPNLFIHGCDFSSKAIEIMKRNELYDKKRCEVFVLDATNPEWEVPFAESSQDIIYLYFMLSAIHPKKTLIVIKQIYKYLKLGGRVFFRDYGKYDLVQLSFGKGRCISDDCYVRADKTMVYFFTQKEISNLFKSAGFAEQQNIINIKHDSFITNRFNIRIQAEYQVPYF